jgi:hypothetical protein
MMFKLIKVTSEMAIVLFIVGGILMMELIARYGGLIILGGLGLLAWHLHRKAFRKHEENMEDPRITEHREFLRSLDKVGKGGRIQ